MTKKELARALATEMQKIKADLDIEHTATVLMRGMTSREMKLALNRKGAAV